MPSSSTSSPPAGSLANTEAKVLQGVLALLQSAESLPVGEMYRAFAPAASVVGAGVVVAGGVVVVVELEVVLEVVVEVPVVEVEPEVVVEVEVVLVDGEVVVVVVVLGVVVTDVVDTVDGAAVGVLDVSVVDVPPPHAASEPEVTIRVARRRWRVI